MIVKEAKAEIIFLLAPCLLQASKTLSYQLNSVKSICNIGSLVLILEPKLRSSSSVLFLFKINLVYSVQYTTVFTVCVGHPMKNNVNLMCKKGERLSPLKVHYVLSKAGPSKVGPVGQSCFEQRHRNLNLNYKYIVFSIFFVFF